MKGTVLKHKTRLPAWIAALAGVALWGGSAGWGATQLPPGTFRGSILDRSSLFAETDGQHAGLDPTTGSPQVGQESRTVFLMDALDYGVMSVDYVGVPRVTDTQQSVAGYMNGALAGMLFDVVVAPTSDVLPTTGPTPGDPWQTYFAPGGRYTSTGGTNGAWTDTVSGVGGLLASTSAGYGGLLVVYDVTPGSVNFQGDGVGPMGPWDWTQGTNTSAGSALTMSDDFPTISSATQPWLIAVLAPMPSAYGLPPLASGKDPVGWQSFYGNSNDGLAFANVIGGTAAGNFNTDVFGPGLDIRIEYKLSLVPADGWASSSEDPVQFSMVPEPLAAIFFGTGLITVIGFAARRRMAREA